MRHRMTVFLAAALAALQLFALEVVELTPEQTAFLRMSPAERRERFTNEAYRAKLAQHDWEKMKWHEAAAGESCRWRHLPGVPNLRDLGGLKGLDGREVRTGRVFRSGGFNDNAKYRLVDDEKNPGKKKRQYYGRGKERLTAEARKFQVENFGIRTDIDLRSDGECNEMTGSPIGPQVRWAHTPSHAYGAFHSKDGMSATKKNFALFLDEANYPIAFHCIAGADRTGSLAYLLEALLGVSDADLCLDWELTAFHNPNHKFAHAERYDKLVAGFAKYPGANARERAEGYVKALGFTDMDIARFREIMLK